MCPEILGLPEIGDAEGVVRVAMSPMKNNSRFIVDMNIFMKRLRLELNRYSEGRVRFFSQDNAVRTRTTVLDNRREEQVAANLEALADQIVALPVVVDAAVPLRVAVLPVVGANMVGMNGDSVTAMLRAKVAERSQGRVLFAMPGADAEVDCYLTGQFIADSMRTEGIVNLLDYVAMMDDRIKQGQSLDLYDKSPASLEKLSQTDTQINIASGNSFGSRPSLFNQIQLSASLRDEPNVTKRLNVMLVRVADKLAVYERMFTVEDKLTDGTGRASYILSGEISGVSKRLDGTQSDYLLITMQLVDPVSNEVLWEDGYEVKKASVSGVVYQ
jgi:PBP1b-binding outer membrane lipoprotein LpoB